MLYAEPNYYRRVSVTANDRYFSSQWGLANSADADIDAPEAWELTTGDPDVRVAIVDSGVDYSHPDLAPNLWTNPGEAGDGREDNGVDDDANGLRDDWRGWDWVDADGDPADENGHGTHVAGTAAARGNDRLGVAGVAWRSGLMPLRVLDANGSGTVSDVVAAYRYAAAQGAEVVNANLGSPSFSQAEADAIGAASQTLFVVAAGNGGPDGIGDNNELVPQYPCNHSAPNLICVAAGDRNDGLARFSNYGSASVDLAAPGVDVLSDQPGRSYGYMDGTSMATPHVAGAAALIFAARPDASPLEVKQALLAGAEPKPAFANKTTSGGRLNAQRALDSQAGESPAPAPPAPAPRPPADPGAPAPAPRDENPAQPRSPAAPADDAQAPQASLRVRRRQSLDVVLRRSLKAQVGCSESCSLSPRLLLVPRIARRLKLAKPGRPAVIGRGRRSVADTGRTTIRIAVTPRARKRLKRIESARATVQVTARDKAGNSRTLRRSIALAG